MLIRPRFTEFNNIYIPQHELDFAMILAQYMEEAERYRSDNVMEDIGDWYYVVNGKISGIPSGSPSKVGKK